MPTGVPATALPAGERVPVLGMGTWHMGERASLRAQEVAALRTGLDLGLTLIDTAEMYADGRAEEVVGEVLAGRRDDVFVVSKVLPSHASRRQMMTACEGSLRRLGTDRLDLYLLHWPGRTPLVETVRGFVDLQRAGKIRHWGVSNFGVDDMDELLEVDGADQVQCNQVLYNLTRRGIEYDLLPWSRQRSLPIMAYSPIEQGRVLGDPVVQRLASRYGVVAAQVALAWVLRQDGVIAIPKAGTSAHVHEVRGALDLQLTPEDLRELDQAYPPPSRPTPLAML
jgi:diketogulonate reductase-like aldo/keto reductase